MGWKVWLDALPFQPLIMTFVLGSLSQSSIRNVVLMLFLLVAPTMTLVARGFANLPHGLVRHNSAWELQPKTRGAHYLPAAQPHH